MGTRQKIRFYLMHVETGQRYPVGSDDIIIGKTSGDLLFREDEALAPQHCRIFNSEEGLSIHDLGSHTGTVLDGTKIEARKAYPLKAGSKIKIGDQELLLQENSRAKRVSRRSKQPPPDRISQFALTAAVSILVILLSQQVLRIRPQSNPVATNTVPAVTSPYELVQKELRQTFDQYKQIGRDQQSGKIANTQMMATLRNELLPALQQVQVKLGVVQPSSEFERRKLELDRKMVAAMSGQIQAMIELQATKSAKAEQRLQHYSAELETLSSQAQAFRGRMPAQAPANPK